jgi:hypothetical protein
MSSKLELAAAKWRAKTASAVNKWQNAVSSPSTIAAWVRGVRQFIGQSPSQEVAELYYEGVTSPSAANKYQTKVTSDRALNKYKENLVAGLTAKLEKVAVSRVVEDAYAKAAGV